MQSDNLFEQSSIRKIYLTLALPVTLGMLLSVVYNVADTYFIARTQDTDLVAAVSLCAPVFTLLMAFGNIFGQGGTSLISRLFGRGDREGTKRCSAFCFYAALAVGAAVGLLMLLLHGPLLRLLGANDATLPHARAYYLTLTAAAPALVVQYVPLNLLRAEGMSRESMYGSVSGLIVNIVLDPLFISGLGWGAFGAALASVVGYVFSDLFLLAVLLRKSRILSVDPRLCRIPAADALQIFSIGLSAALTNLMTSFSMVLLNHHLLPYGNDRIAAMGIAQKLSMIILLILIGMSFGAAPAVGYYYGARQSRRLRELLRFQLSLVGGLALGMTALLFLAAKPCVGLFLRDEAIVATGVEMLRWQIVTMFLAAAVTIFTICFQASGMAAEALFVSLLRQGVVFFAVLVLASRIAGYEGVIRAQAITDLLSAALAGALFWTRFYTKLPAPEA